MKDRISEAKFSHSRGEGAEIREGKHKKLMPNTFSVLSPQYYPAAVIQDFLLSSSDLLFSNNILLLNGEEIEFTCAQLAGWDAAVVIQQLTIANNSAEFLWMVNLR